MKAFTIDRSVSLAGSTREVTDEGYLKVWGRVARPGIQEYLAHELGLEGNPNRIVNVYRPAEEVFSTDSLSSYAHKDVTDDHPSDLVTCDSFRLHSVGHVTDAGAQDGDWVVTPMLIKHADTIRKVQDGKAELSAGYLAEYVAQAGTTQDGTPYEFIQKNIRINHVAVVDAARAGKEARIFDATPQPKGTTMAQRKVFLDRKKSRTVTLDEEAAAVVEAAIEALEDAQEDAEKRAAEAEAEAEKKDSEIEALQAKVEAMPSDEDMEKTVQDRVAQLLTVTKQARKLVKGFDSKSVNPVEIKREALAKLRPTKDWSAKSAIQLDAAWEVFCDAEGDDKDEDDEDDKKTNDGIGRDFQTLDSSVMPVYGKKTSETVSAYAKFLKGEK